MDDSAHTSETPDPAGGTTDATGTAAQASRRLITEDWAATILGLALLALCLVGVIGKGMVP